VAAGLASLARLACTAMWLGWLLAAAANLRSGCTCQGRMLGHWRERLGTERRIEARAHMLRAAAQRQPYVSTGLGSRLHGTHEAPTALHPAARAAQVPLSLKVSCAALLSSPQTLLSRRAPYGSNACRNQARPLQRGPCVQNLAMDPSASPATSSGVLTRPKMALRCGNRPHLHKARD
jgi:hypothetical protein